jgi:hypothetical protein
MHYHNVEDDGGMVTYCDIHGEELIAVHGESLYVCDCEGKSGQCVVCDEYDVEGSVS